MIELKARFPLTGGARRRLDLFAYLPAQLQINQRSLPRERFLSGVISHARYQVRREGLDILISDHPDNPLWRLEHVEGGSRQRADGSQEEDRDAGAADAGGTQALDADDLHVEGGDAGGHAAQYGGSTDHPQSDDHPQSGDYHHAPYDSQYELRMVCNLFHSAFKEELRDAVAAGASDGGAHAPHGAPVASDGVDSVAGGARGASGRADGCGGEAGASGGGHSVAGGARDASDSVADGTSGDRSVSGRGGPASAGSSGASTGVARVVMRGRAVLDRCERVLMDHEDIAQPAREYLWGTTARRVARTIISEGRKPASGISRTPPGAAVKPASGAGDLPVGDWDRAGGPPPGHGAGADGPTAGQGPRASGLTRQERELLDEWLREIEATAERWGVVTLHADPDQVARDAELKKWVQSILYLPARDSNRNQRIFQVAAALAAGLAMTVAVIATVFAEARWSGGSLPWALALIGAYIVKDRVKEGTRAVLVRRIPGLVQDRVTLLSEPDDGVRSPRRRVVARRVAVLRFPYAPNGLSCVQLQKRFTFRLRRMRRHQRVDAVVEILRVDVSDWLQRMDRAWKYWPRRTAEGELELASVPRKYTIYVRATIDSRNDAWYQITATRQEITDITELPEAPFGAQ